MAVLMVLEGPGVSAERYERVNEIMGIHGDADAPDGLIDHFAATDGDDFVICDVWESEEALGKFAETRLIPAQKEAGMPEVQPWVMPVHNRLLGKSNDAGVLVLIEIADLGADAYDEMTQHMSAHVNNEHPSVSHTAAIREGGGMVVVDVWNSADAFGAFAQEQIAPAGQRVGLAEIAPRMLPVHNRIRGTVAQSAA